MNAVDLTAEEMVAASDVASSKRPSPSSSRNTGRRSKIPRVSDFESGSEYKIKERSNNDDYGESDSEAGDIDNDGVTRRLRYPLRSIKVKKAFDFESKDGDSKIHSVDGEEDGQASKPADSALMANEEISPSGVTPRIDPESPNFIRRRPSSKLQKPMVVVCVPSSIHTKALENPSSSPRPSLSVTTTNHHSVKEDCTTIQPKGSQGQSKTQSTAIKCESSGSPKVRSSSAPMLQTATALRRSIRLISVPGPNGLGTGANSHSQEYEHLMETFTIQKPATVAKRIRQPLPTSASFNASTDLPVARCRNTASTSEPIAEAKPCVPYRSSEPQVVEENCHVLTLESTDQNTIPQSTRAKPWPTPEPIAELITRQLASQKPSSLGLFSQKSIDDTNSLPRVRESPTANAGIAETPRKDLTLEPKPSPNLAVEPTLRPLLPAKSPLVGSAPAGPDLSQTPMSKLNQQDSIPPIVRSLSIPNILTQIQRQASTEQGAAWPFDFTGERSPSAV